MASSRMTGATHGAATAAVVVATVFTTVTCAPVPNPVLDSTGSPIRTVTIQGDVRNIDVVATAIAAVDLDCPAPGVQLQHVVAYRSDRVGTPLQVEIVARACGREAKYACWNGWEYFVQCVREP